MTYEEAKIEAYAALIPKVGACFRIRLPQEQRHDPPEYIVVQVINSWPWCVEYSVISASASYRFRGGAETWKVRRLSLWWECRNLLTITECPPVPATFLGE